MPFLPSVLVTIFNITSICKYSLGLFKISDFFACFFFVQRNCGILLLTGSSGAGKTALVDVLSQSFEYQLKEWINPVTQEYQGM